MQNKKRGVVLYFDACDELNALTPEQRGWVLSALNDFAQACAEDVGTDMKAVLDRYPQLSPENHVACLVRFETIRRDTLRWKKRQADSPWNGGGNSRRHSEELRGYVQEMERSRERRDRRPEEAWKYVK